MMGQREFIHYQVFSRTLDLPSGVTIAKGRGGGDDSFIRESVKIFFWVAGILTTLGAMPTMLSSAGRLRLSVGLRYSVAE
jgi:hypothetical protein